MAKTDSRPPGSKKILCHIDPKIAKEIVALAYERNITRDQLVRGIVQNYFSTNSVNVNSVEENKQWARIQK